MERALPVGHYHIVLTLPAQLRTLTSKNRRVVYQLIFEAAAETIKELTADRFGILPGITAVLHSWSRELLTHPHVHLIVTAGGLLLDGSGWKDVGAARDRTPKHRLRPASRTAKPFFLPKAVISDLFGKKLLSKLKKAFGPDFVPAYIRRKLYRMRWNSHVKEPFTDKKRLFGYLSQYTHRVAISDYRLLEVDEHKVTFRTRGEGVLSLAPMEFMRRFTDHWLPKNFTRIRHYGLYSSTKVPTLLAQAHELLADRNTIKPLEPVDLVGPDDPALLAMIVAEQIRSGVICEKCDSRDMIRESLKKRNNKPRGPP